MEATRGDKSLGQRPGKGLMMTVGHSNHSLPAFLALLKQHGLGGLLDVRSVPASSRFPQFHKQSLADACVQYALDYVWIPELGGKGEGGVDANLRTPQGIAALMRVHAIACESDKPYALMCSEGQWKECHRQILTLTTDARVDAQVLASELCRRGVQVQHINREGLLEVHPYSMKHGQHPEPDSACCAPAALPSQEAAGSDRKQQNKHLVKQLKLRLGEDGYRDFRQLSHAFACGGIHAIEYRDQCLALLASTSSEDLESTGEVLPVGPLQIIRLLASLLPDELKRAELISVLPSDNGGADQQQHQTASETMYSSPFPGERTQVMQKCVIIAVRFHHILDENKREMLVAWGLELRLSGFSKPGTPGLVILEGPKRHAYEYVKRLRSLQWQTMELRMEMVVEQAHMVAEFCELSLNNQGMREAERLCKQVGLAKLWSAATRDGKGAAVSAELQRGMTYSEKRVADEYRRNLDPQQQVMLGR